MVNTQTKYWQLFSSFFKIGAFTFGGGWAMISIIEREVVDRHGWIEKEEFIDLLFFNRELNCLVAVELKMGKFKTSYLGQLNGYLQALDDTVRKPHENQSIGIILCQDAKKDFAFLRLRSRYCLGIFI